jgi:hypothetical protein
MADGIIAGMEERPESGPSARPRRARRKPTSDPPELRVVPLADARAEASKRPRRPRRKVLTRADILTAPMETQPITGTELSVREQSVNETHALLADDADKDLDDREFTVHAVARQLAGDPAPGIDDVRAWGDDQLLAGARAMLSFPPLQATVDGVEQPPDPDEMVAMPDPLTYGSFREAITAVPKRWESKLAETAGRISELGVPRMASILDSGMIEAVRAAQSNHLSAVGPDSVFGSALGALTNSRLLDIAKSPAFDIARSNPALDAIRNSPAVTMKLPDLDFTRGIAEQARALNDTAGIAQELSKFQASTIAAERLAKPIDFGERLREPVMAMPAIAPYHPEVDAIDALGGRIDAMAENQARADREALEVMTGLTELVRDQGTATQGVIAEVKALRNDQRWPNRAVIIGAFLAGALLVVGAITALPIVKDLLGL